MEWQLEWTKLLLGETKLLLEKQQEDQLKSILEKHEERQQDDQLKSILEVTKKWLDWLSLLVGLMSVLFLGHVINLL